MIDTEQSIVVNAGIDSVWDYVKDMRRWAELLPGRQSCETLDANQSRWLIKVGVGGLVRTVNVLVYVEHWGGPERVDFTFKLEGDPVVGGGSYIALRKAAMETAVTLKVRVAGSGPMAAMWEAMSKPLLPLLAGTFASKLKAEIEINAGVPASRDAVAARTTWLRKLWWAVIQRRLA